MRAGIGLVGILLAIGIIVYLFSGSEIEKIKQGEEVKKEVRQIAGYSQDSTPATDSFLTEGQMKGSKLAALQVTSVTPGGAMDTFYGLKTGDEILGVGDTTIDTLANNDEELAKAMVVQEGYQKQKSLTVRRSGQKLTLPLSPQAAAAAAASGSGLDDGPSSAEPNAATTPPPAPAPQPQKSGGIQGQLDAIQNAAGGGQQQSE